MEGQLVSSYPVRLELDADTKVARWRPFFAMLLAIPHFVLLYVLQGVTSVLVLVSWFTILFTKRIPQGILDFEAMTLRYQWRTMAFSLGLTEPYPPFEFEMEVADDGDYPARFELDPPGELSRGLIFVKWVLAVPHFIVLFVIYIGFLFAWCFGSLAVLFTGRWPDGIRDYLVGTFRWTQRVTAYTYLLTDEYPPFDLR